MMGVHVLETDGGDLGAYLCLTIFESIIVGWHDIGFWIGVGDKIASEETGLFAVVDEDVHKAGFLDLGNDVVDHRGGHNGDDICPCVLEG